MADGLSEFCIAVAVVSFALASVTSSCFPVASSIPFGFRDVRWPENVVVDALRALHVGDFSPETYAR